MTPLLSIMIPLTPDRRDSYSELMDIIIKQMFALGLEEQIQCTFDLDNKEVAIGEKRERMYANAIGEYTWQIDSDDSIHFMAIHEIWEALKTNPDCVTFQERCLINEQYFSSNHSLRYDDWGESQDGFDYVRTPFMKSVIKTEIARSVPIPHIRYGEDHEWAKALKPHLKTEVHIDKELYIYQHNSKPEDFNERYGIR